MLFKQIKLPARHGFTTNLTLLCIRGTLRRESPRVSGEEDESPKCNLERISGIDSYYWQANEVF